MSIGKVLTVVAFISAVSSYSVNGQKTDSLKCESLITETNDKVSGNKFINSTKKILISKDKKNGIAIMIMSPASGETKGAMIIVIDVLGSSPCISEEQKMNVLFRDGTRLELKNGNTNCSGRFNVYFGGDFKLSPKYKELSTKEIETIRVWTTNGAIQEDLSNSDSKKLMKTFRCFADR